MQKLIDYQADRIEMTLRAHRILARVTGGLVAPRWVRHLLSLGWGTRPEQVSRLEGDLAHRLGIQGVRVAQSDGRLYVDVPRPDGPVISLWSLCKRLDQIPPHAAMLGIGQDGQPLLLRLASPDVAHALVAGTTGSGKTALARSIALSLAMHNRQGEIQLLIVDPQGHKYTSLAGLPHLLCPVVTEIEGAAHALSELVALFEERSQIGTCQPRVVAIIDELADLVALGGEPVLKAVTRLAQRGRGAGVHLVACTQKPTAASIGSLVKSNFPARLVGRVTSAGDASLASSLASSRRSSGSRHASAT